MAYQNPYMDALSAGSKASDSAGELANKFGSLANKAYDSAGSLQYKMISMLQQEEQLKAQQLNNVMSNMASILAQKMSDDTRIKTTQMSNDTSMKIAKMNYNAKVQTAKLNNNNKYDMTIYDKNGNQYKVDSANIKQVMKYSNIADPNNKANSNYFNKINSVIYNTKDYDDYMKTAKQYGLPSITKDQYMLNKSKYNISNYANSLKDPKQKKELLTNVAMLIQATGNGNLKASTQLLGQMLNKYNNNPTMKASTINLFMKTLNERKTALLKLLQTNKNKDPKVTEQINNEISNIDKTINATKSFNIINNANTPVGIGDKLDLTLGSNQLALLNKFKDSSVKTSVQAFDELQKNTLAKPLVDGKKLKELATGNYNIVSKKLGDLGNFVDSTIKGIFGGVNTISGKTRSEILSNINEKQMSMLFKAAFVKTLGSQQGKELMTNFGLNPAQVMNYGNTFYKKYSNRLFSSKNGLDDLNDANGLFINKKDDVYMPKINMLSTIYKLKSSGVNIDELNTKNPLYNINKALQDKNINPTKLFLYKYILTYANKKGIKMAKPGQIIYENNDDFKNLKNTLKAVYNMDPINLQKYVAGILTDASLNKTAELATKNK